MMRALAVAAILAMIITIAIGRSTPPASPPIKAEPIAVPLKSAREELYPAAAFDAPKTVRTIPIVRQAPQIAEQKVTTAAPVAESDEVVIRRERRHRAHRASGRDLCARHGMRKVDYGRRWRCKR
jgi:hypothetical protein